MLTMLMADLANGGPRSPGGVDQWKQDTVTEELWNQRTSQFNYEITTKLTLFNQTKATGNQLTGGQGTSPI